MDGLLAVRRHDATGAVEKRYDVVRDERSNVAGLLDESGKLVAGFEYTPFGQIAAVDSADPAVLAEPASICPLLFSMKYLERELPGSATGQGQVYYFGYRYLDARLGKWLSRDPIAEQGGLNLYAYVTNDPVNLVDPLGLEGDETTKQPDFDWRLTRKQYDAILAGDKVPTDFFPSDAIIPFSADGLDIFLRVEAVQESENIKKFEGMDGFRGRIAYGTAAWDSAHESMKTISPDGYYYLKIKADERARIEDLRSRTVGATVFGREVRLGWQSDEQIAANLKAVEENLDNIHIALDAVGTIDPTPLSDGTNALIYTIRGDRLNAGISMVAIVPYVGDSAKVVKYSVKIVKHTPEGIKVVEHTAKNAEEMMELVKKATDKSPNAVGQAGENAVSAAFDIGRKQKILINGRTRIPDGITDTTLSEIKNVQSLSYTQQLRDFADIAAQRGLQYDLYVRPSTQLTGPLQKAIQDGVINLKYIPGAK